MFQCAGLVTVREAISFWAFLVTKPQSWKPVCAEMRGKKVWQEAKGVEREEGENLNITSLNLEEILGAPRFQQVARWEAQMLLGLYPCKMAKVKKAALFSSLVMLQLYYLYVWPKVKKLFWKPSSWSSSESLKKKIWEPFSWKCAQKILRWVFN